MQSAIRYMTWFQQSALAALLIAMQAVLSLSYQYLPDLPYPLNIQNPEIPGFFVSVCTITFFAGLGSGIALGWRRLPFIVLYLIGTTIAMWGLMGVVMCTGGLIRHISGKEIVTDFFSYLPIILREDSFPAAIWSTAGGLCGSLVHFWLKNNIGVTNQSFKFLLHISIAALISIFVFTVGALILGVWSVFIGQIFFVGIVFGIFSPEKSIRLAGISQLLLGLIVVSWLHATVHGEGGMVIPFVFCFGIPAFVFLGVLGTFYGKFLNKRFIEQRIS